MSVFSDEFVPYGPGRKAPIRGLKDVDLLERMRGYRRSVARRYKIVKPHRIARDLGAETKLWVSTKVDGELWFLIKQQGEVALCAYNGRVLQGVPVVEEAARLLTGVDDVMIPGELFSSAGEGRPRVHNVAFSLGDGGLAKTLGFDAFDLLSVGDQDYFGRPYEERYARLDELLGAGELCTPVTTVVGDAQTAVGCWQEWVASKKAEGLVVRNETGKIFKIKPTVTIDLVVIAFGERTIGEIRQVRELTVGLARDDGTLQVVGTVSNGLSETDRADWYDRLAAIEVPSSFRMPNSEGTLCRFVRPEIIVEVKCSDLLTRSGGDRQIRRMAVRFDGATGYEAVGSMPIVAMIHPVLVREREDKMPDVGSVGLDQVYKTVPFEARHEEARRQTLPRAQILRRGAYIKESKGGIMVRKFVAIATNKADLDPRFPPYVVHFTDFSANRATPLDTNLRVAASPESLDARIDEWLRAKIKRGWKEA